MKTGRRSVSKDTTQNRLAQNLSKRESSSSVFRWRCQAHTCKLRTVRVPLRPMADHKGAYAGCFLVYLLTLVCRSSYEATTQPCQTRHQECKTLYVGHGAQYPIVTDMAFVAFYGRMDGDAQFKCAMTSVAPNIKNSWVIHPSVCASLLLRLRCTTSEPCFE